MIPQHTVELRKAILVSTEWTIGSIIDDKVISSKNSIKFEVLFNPNSTVKVLKKPHSADYDG